MQIIAVVTKDPAVLPQASEELILESKTNINLYPDSPGGSNSQGACSNSLGSRKSSVCSISSINSSSSGSPGHQFQRSLSQVRRNRFVVTIICYSFVQAQLWNAIISYIGACIYSLLCIFYQILFFLMLYLFSLLILFFTFRSIVLSGDTFETRWI